MGFAKDMTTLDIKAELAALNVRIDDFEAAPDEDVAHGGSPGEWMYERHEELTNELSKRKMDAMANEARAR